MGVHEDTLQGLQDMLEYAKGNKEKGRLRTRELDITPEEQRELQTIISTEEKYRCNNDKRTGRDKSGLTTMQREL